MKVSVIVCAVLAFTSLKIWASPGDLLWRFPALGGYAASSPAIGLDGTIYFGSSNRNLYAIKPEGGLKWKYQTGGAIDDSPAIQDDGTIYFGSFDTYFYALSPDGKLLWRYQTGGLIRSTPALAAGGTILFGSYDKNLYALNPDGTLKWKFAAGAEIGSSPLISIDGSVNFGDTNGMVYSLTSQGSLRWKHATGGAINWSSVAAGYDGVLYIGSWDGYLYSISSDGTLKWKYRTAGKIGSSPALGENGVIYFESCDTFFYALNPDGTLLWKYDVQNKNYGCHPVIGSDGTIYVGSDDGYMYALDPGGALKWRYKTGGPLWTTGATIDERGILYCVSSDGYIYALDTGTGAGIARTPWPKFHGDLRNTGRMETLSVSSSLIKIQDIRPNETGTATVTIRNGGSKPVSIERIGITNDRFKVSPESGVVPPSDSLVITITFSPMTTDEEQAYLTIQLADRKIPVYVMGNPPKEPVRVTVHLITRDQDTGELLPCRVQIIASDGQYWGPKGIMSNNRLFFYTPGDTTLVVPAGTATIYLYRGTEYEPVLGKTVEISKNLLTPLEYSLKRWIHLKELGWYSCDNQVIADGSLDPRGIYYAQLGEDLNILQFDALGDGNRTWDYQYWRTDKFPFSIPFYPLVIGEEWRSASWQNHMITMNCSRPLSAYGNGYYTVLNCPYRFSYPPALDFCEEAHSLGGIILACHPFPGYEPFTLPPEHPYERNTAYEAPVDIALGKMDGMQIYIYDQCDTWNRYVWYKLLNCGFKVPPYAGTDSNFIGSSFGVYPGRVRCYVQVPGQNDDLSFSDWVRESVKGRSFVSTGAALFLTVNGEMPGADLTLKSMNGTAKVSVRADARWMGGIKTVYILVNGETAVSQSFGGSREAVLSVEIPLTKSSWIAARVEGNPVSMFYGNAHTAPVYVTVDNKPIRSRKDALFFVDWIDKHIARLDSANHFDTPEHKKRMFDLYRKGQDVYRARADTTFATAVDAPLPGQFVLFPNSPNPFNAVTTITYSLPRECHVSFDVYDILGRKVVSLENKIKPAGMHRVVWNGTDAKGNSLGSNVYLYRFKAGDFIRHGKMVLMK
ncbi:MAG: PQQ-binding-like beta-propeller repeat protein [Candidatus Latescibacter sp.]|nr:PQQ-binding-like beta-propeller repeat protein [Candidatus Latescibacter sp.]